MNGGGSSAQPERVYQPGWSEAIIRVKKGASSPEIVKTESKIIKKNMSINTPPSLLSLLLTTNWPRMHKPFFESAKLWSVTHQTALLRECKSEVREVGSEISFELIFEEAIPCSTIPDPVMVGTMSAPLNF